jgi:deoxyribodipyrimidine photolyase
MPSRWIHQPWTLPEQDRQQWLKSTYPEPIVDLAQSRAEALAGYQHIKGLS